MLTVSDLKCVGTATEADDNSVVAIGGAKATSKKKFFRNLSGLFQIVSSAGGDTTQTVTVYYRDVAQSIQNEVKLLTGLTPVAFVAVMDKVLKAIKSATTTGDVALESQTAERTGTAQGGSANGIILDAAASAVNAFYVDYIIRITAGTGAGQIRQGKAYVGATKVLTVNYAWTTVPDATSQFRISAGLFFDRNPYEVLEVRRLFYNAAANAPGGGAIDFYDKLHYVNAGAQSLLSATVSLLANPSGKVSFGLGSVNGSATNGGGNNRTVAPAGITFATTPVAVPGTDLAAADSIEVWVKLALDDGDDALDSYADMSLSGTSAA